MRGEKLQFTPGSDPWERQPRESAEKWRQFNVYRGVRPDGTVDDANPDRNKRSLVRTAEKLAKSYSHIRDVASVNRWTERAAAWDSEQQREYDAEFRVKRREAAKADAAVLDMMITKAASGLRALNAEDYSASDLIRLADVSLRHRRALYGDPTAVITMQGPEGAPIAVELADYCAMTPSERIAATAELAADVLRRSAAASSAGETVELELPEEDEEL